MKTILPSLLTLSLLTGCASAAFAGTKKNADGKSQSTSTHKRNSSGRHRSSANKSGTSHSGSVPKNTN